MPHAFLISSEMLMLPLLVSSSGLGLLVIGAGAGFAAGGGASAVLAGGGGSEPQPRAVPRAKSESARFIVRASFRGLYNTGPRTRNAKKASTIPLCMDLSQRAFAACRMIRRRARCGAGRP